MKQLIETSVYVKIQDSRVFFLLRLEVLSRGKAEFKVLLTV